MKLNNFVYLFPVFLLTSACGGGGSGDSTPTKRDYSINLIIDSVYPYYVNSGNTIDDYNLRYAKQTLSIVNTDIN